MPLSPPRPLAPALDHAGEGGSARRRVRIGHLWIDALTFEDALQETERLVQRGAGGCVFTPNVDHVVTAEDDEAFRAAYDGADLSLADGQLLVWASRLLGTPLPAKISGSDLMWPLAELAARRGWRLYLLGGPPGVAQAAAARLEQRLGVAVAGVDAPAVGLDEPSGEEQAAVERIQAARPQLVFVGLGAPKQERWIHRVLPRIRPAVAVGIGAGLDFLAGRMPRAPRWASRAGLEWLFRLAHEPRRLAHRYLIKDPRFALILARAAREPKRGRVRQVR